MMKKFKEINSKFIKKIVLVLSCSVFFAPTIPIAATNDVPTLEEIITNYDVTLDEAREIQSNMENENAYYVGEFSVPEKENRHNRTFSNLDYESLKEQLAYEFKDVDNENEVLQKIAELMPNEEEPNMTTRSGFTGVSIPFYRQQNSYYCGPAATAMVLAGRGVYYSQSSLASITWLETDIYGYTPGSYIRYTLNAVLGLGNWYVYREVNSDDYGLLASRILITLGAGYAPIVAVYQNGSDSRVLEGHTTGYLRHFVPIYGYAYQNVFYRDSASGLGGRFSSVPQSGMVNVRTMSYLIWGGSIVY